MDKSTLEKVIRFAEKTDHFLLATVAPDGRPHIAAAGELSLNSDGLIEVAAWFCHTTVANLQENSHISLVVWNQTKDNGYQLLGVAEKIEEIAMMDGYVPEVEEKISFPQIERKLIIRIDQILDFSQTGQSDREIQ